MSKQRKTSLSKIIIMIGMVFCVVFASTLKAAIDNLNNSKKTCQLAEEEQDDEDTCNEKELFSKFLHPVNAILNIACIPSLKTTYQCVFHINKPRFKIHTPPPDFFVVFS